MPPSIRKIYLEPTNHCNLECETCIRNTWTSEFAEMPLSLVERLAEELHGLPELENMVLAGFGEPLCHPQITEIITVLSMTGARVELISNAALLDEAMCRRLLKSGLHRLWVSVDAASVEQYEKIRKGARHDELLENLIRLAKLRAAEQYPLELGFSFVAMKSNVHELPGIVRLAKDLGATRLKVTHVLPYTAEMLGEALYHEAMQVLPENLDEGGLKIDWPAQVVDKGLQAQPADPNTRDYCRFIQEESVVIGADGRVAPCLALLYDNQTFLHGYERNIKPQAYGNLHQSTLGEIWKNADYAAFRDRVRSFEFSPCTTCGGCERLSCNDEDCFGNPFPVCGACLWAQGVIQCP